MSESKIEQELLAATGLKPKKTEDRQAYLSRLMRATSKLEDDAWEHLTKDAQDWNNGAAEAHKAGSELEDFPDYADEEPVDEEIDEEEEAPVEAKSNGKKTEKKEAKVETSRPRKVSACHTIKKMVVKKPTITVVEIAEKLKADGLKVSDVTIATLRSDCRDTLRVLNEAGVGNFNL